MTERPPEHQRHKRVLVLDDVAINQEVLAEALLSRCPELQVARVNSVREARLQLQAWEFNLIFLDLYLPDGRGDALLTELRANADWRANAAVAIAVTADNDAECRRHLLAKGFAEVLLKPWRLSSVEQIADRYLGSINDTGLFDPTQSLRSVGGHAALLPKLRALFYAELRHSAPELERSLLAGDVDRAEHFRHRLAGAAAFAGALGLSQALEQLRISPEPSARAAVSQVTQALLAQADKCV